MPFSPENLLTQLDRRDIIDWALELKNGKEAYAFLMQTVGTPKLNVGQTRNGLHALFRIYRHGSAADVLQKFVDLAANADQEVRSEAVQLAIGMVRFCNHAGNAPLSLSKTQERVLRDATARGLTKKVAELAAGFFST
jgi:hypothetical protein